MPLTPEDKRITQLPEATTLAGNELFIVVADILSTATNKKVTAQTLRDYYANAVSVGTTTTGAEGTLANVTYSNGIFNFTIPRGDTGAQGVQGSQGPTGSQGAQGATGPQGLQGPQGEIGPTGVQGPQGPQGFDGPQGPQGVQGYTGPQGDVGPQGPQGATGPQGLQGQAGPMGPQGDIGPTGPQGPIGPAGPQGDIGPTGPQGPQGDDGPQGAFGPQGATGPQGPQGDIGPQGATGSTGPQGPQGDAGPQGPQGLSLTAGDHQNQPLVWDAGYSEWVAAGDGSTAPMVLFYNPLSGSTPVQESWFGNGSPNIYLSRASAAGPQSYSSLLQINLAEYASDDSQIYLERAVGPIFLFARSRISPTSADIRVGGPDAGAVLFTDNVEAFVGVGDAYGSVKFRAGDATRSPQDGDIWTYDFATESVVPRPPAVSGASVLEVQVFS